MKTLIHAIAIAAILFPLSVFSQPESIHADNNGMSIADTTGRDILSITPTKDNSDGFSLSISGYEIHFGAGSSSDGRQYDRIVRKERDRTPDYIDQTLLFSGRALSRQKRYRTPLPLLEFGFTGFHENNYKIFLPERKGFMEPNLSKSLHIQWNVLRLSESLNYRRNLGISSAFGLSWDRYVFKNFLQNEHGIPRPAGTSKTANQSEMRTFSLHIPIILGYNNKSFGIAAGMYGNLVVSRKNKIEQHMFKDNLVLAVNKPQVGAILRLKFKWISLFANYAFTHVFESGSAPETQAITFGIGIL